MKRNLTASWTWHRFVRNVPLATCALVLTAVLCLAIDAERRAVQNETESMAQSARAAPLMPASEQQAALTAWREQLQAEVGRLPVRKNAAAIVRAASGILEASGVAIDSVNTSQAAYTSTPYSTLTLEARMTGSAVRTASALSDILADSPGWSIQRISIERQAEGMASIEAMLVLVHGGTP